MLSQIKLLIEGYHLKLTGVACPEEYDVFDCSGNQVCYIRVWHDKVRAYDYEYGQNVMYESDIEGDGTFTKEERMFHLRAIINSIQELILNAQLNQFVELY